MILRAYKVPGTVLGVEHTLSMVLHLFASCCYHSSHFADQEVSLKRQIAGLDRECFIHV